MKKYIFALLLLAPLLSFTQSLVRGPYLQMATQDGIVIRWRTDVPTDTRVRYGTAPGNLSQTYYDATQTTEHRAQLSGLSTFSEYFYAVGTNSADLAGDDNIHFFKTLPSSGDPVAMRIWAIGDFGKGNSNQRLVRDSYITESNQTGKADVWLWLGDNVYDVGADQEYTDKLFHPTNGYPSIFPNTVFWPTPGNHDYTSVNLLSSPENHTGPYFDLVDVPTNGEAGGVPSGYELYYSYDYGNVHFISLNSEITTWTATTSSQLGIWLTDDLQQNQLPWTIVYFHQPPHSKGSHDSDDFWEIPMSLMRANYMPILEQFGVDLILCGHSHVYERSYLVNGFYGNSGDFNVGQHAVSYTSGTDSIGEKYVKSFSPSSPAARGNGTVYAVVGNSGSNTSNPDLNHPMMYANYGCDTCMGSLIIDVQGNALEGWFLATDGSKQDVFNIEKNLLVEVETDRELVESLVLYPNPMRNVLNVRLEMNEKAKVKTALYDLNGRLVIQEKLGRVNPGLNEYEMNTSGLASGSYIFRMNAGKKEFSRRIIKR